MIEISIKEWGFVGLLSLMVAIITFLPTFVGLVITPPDSVFLGTQAINADDTLVYYSWIEQAKDGDFLFKNLYSTEDNVRYIFDPFWLSVGLFAKIFSLSSFAAYQLARVFLIPVFLAIAYIVLSYFFVEEKKRKLCFIFLVFSSGLGGVIALGSSLGFYQFWPPPMDIWVAESVTFFTLFHSPHFIASLTSILLIFLLALHAFEKQKTFYSFFAGVAALIFFQFHPYYVPTIFGVLSVYIIIQSFRSFAIKWDLIKHFLIIILMSMPAILYHFWTLSIFWTRQAHALQNNLPTPPFYNLILTYGFLFILSLFGIIALLQKFPKDNKDIFLLTWWGVQLAMPYMPFLNYQRKMVEGLHVVMVFTAIFGIFFLKDFLEKNNFLKGSFLKNKFILTGFFILFFTFSNFSILMQNFNFYLSHHRYAFLSKDKQEAMIWLKEKTPQESVLFASYFNGNLIPAFSARTVYLGHWGMTAEASKKLEQTKQFFEKWGNKARFVFLKINQIDYLFYGPEERQYQNFDPESVDFLEKVYQNDEVAIYKVK